MYIKLLSGRLTYLRNMTQVNVLPGLSPAPDPAVESAALALSSVERDTLQQRLQLLDAPEEWAAFSLPEKTGASAARC